MAKDTIIDEELAREQGQRWGLRERRRGGDDVSAPETRDGQEPTWTTIADRDDASAGDRRGRVAGDGPEPAEASAPEPKPKRPSKMAEFLGGMVSGNILSKAEVRKQYPYMMFLAVLMMLYIANTFRMQHLYRRQQSLTREVKELRAKSVTLSANLAEKTRRSRVLEELEERGVELEESVVPPIVIER